MMVRDRLASACASCALGGLSSCASEHGILLFGRDGVGLRGREGRLGLQEVGGILLRLLDGGGVLLLQPLVAIGFLLREGQRGLRLRHLLVGLIDLCLLRRDLRETRLSTLRLCLVVLRDVVAIVEADQLGAGARPADCPSPARRRWRRRPGR